MNLGAINGFAINGSVGFPIQGYALANPRGSVLAVNDYAFAKDGEVVYWALEASTGFLTFTKVPCQYFKATVFGYQINRPFGGLSYIEAMVPSATQYSSIINNAQGFRIKILYPNSEHTFIGFSSYSVPPAPLVREYTSATNQDSCLVKGYFLFTSPPELILNYTRNLTGIRSKSTTAQGKRVICNLDPVLAVGMSANDGISSMLVKTVVYYVSATDQYMEVYDYFL
jgi:hypothetical protein